MLKETKGDREQSLMKIVSGNENLEEMER